MNTQLAITYCFYIVLLAMSGTGEYLHLFPMGTAATVLGGVLGHGISEISHITGSNASSSNGVTTK